MVGRQAQRADLGGKAQPAEVLHRARLRGVGLRRVRDAGLGIDQQAVDAAPAELAGQHQAERAGAGDQDIGLRSPATKSEYTQPGRLACNVMLYSGLDDTGGAGRSALCSKDEETAR